MAGGSLFVAPWADRFGRRAVTCCCLAVITVGMFGSALAQSPAQLTALRVLTGIGIGGILASLNVITSEYSSRRVAQHRDQPAGHGLSDRRHGGGTHRGLPHHGYGWRSAFLFGAVASGLMIPVVIRSLPESLDFLLARRPPDALRG